MRVDLIALRVTSNSREVHMCHMCRCNSKQDQSNVKHPQCVHLVHGSGVSGQKYSLQKRFPEPGQAPVRLRLPSSVKDTAKAFAERVDQQNRQNCELCGQMLPTMVPAGDSAANRQGPQHWPVKRKLIAEIAIPPSKPTYHVNMALHSLHTCVLRPLMYHGQPALQSLLSHACHAGNMPLVIHLYHAQMSCTFLCLCLHSPSVATTLVFLACTAPRLSIYTGSSLAGGTLLMSAVQNLQRVACLLTSS